MGDKKKKDKSKAKEKEDKARKKELREKLERERKQKELEAEADAMVDPIYASGLADAYKYFLQELYKEGVRFNIYQFAAQKILKYQKLQKSKQKRMQELQLE